MLLASPPGLISACHFLLAHKTIRPFPGIHSHVGWYRLWVITGQCLQVQFMQSTPQLTMVWLTLSKHAPSPSGSETHSRSVSLKKSIDDLILSDTVHTEKRTGENDDKYLLYQVDWAIWPRCVPLIMLQRPSTGKEAFPP